MEGGCWQRRGQPGHCLSLLTHTGNLEPPILEVCLTPAYLGNTGSPTTDSSPESSVLPAGAQDTCSQETCRSSTSSFSPQIFLNIIDRCLQIEGEKEKIRVSFEKEYSDATQASAPPPFSIVFYHMTYKFIYAQKSPSLQHQGVSQKPKRVPLLYQSRVSDVYIHQI